MKRPSAVLFVFAMSLVTVSANAQSVTPMDRDRAIKYLQTTKANILEATKGLSEAQWNFKPGPDRWSVAEVMEHIAASEDFLLDRIVQKVMTAPARPEGEDLKAIDELVVARIPDRTNKVQAPEPLKPSKRFGSPDGSLKHFLESRGKTIDFLEKTPDLRAHAMDSPLGKKLDAYQWLLFISAHSERHTKQILEVKASPDYPRS